MNTLTQPIPYTTPPLTFLRILNRRIASTAKSIGLLKYDLQAKRDHKKQLLIESVKIQKRKFEDQKLIKKIPRGHSSKSKPSLRIGKKESGHVKKAMLTPEDMIAAMTVEDRLQMVKMLTQQQG